MWVRCEADISFWEGLIFIFCEEELAVIDFPSTKHPFNRSIIGLFFKVKASLLCIFCVSPRWHQSILKFCLASNTTLTPFQNKRSIVQLDIKHWRDKTNVELLLWRQLAKEEEILMNRDGLNQECRLYKQGCNYSYIFHCSKHIFS